MYGISIAMFQQKAMVDQTKCIWSIWDYGINLKGVKKGSMNIYVSMKKSQQKYHALLGQSSAVSKAPETMNL